MKPSPKRVPPIARELLSAAAKPSPPTSRTVLEAREAAKRFGAFVALDGFLRGPKGEDTLAGLADQAEASAALIGRILAGQDVWRFEGSAK